MTDVLKATSELEAVARRLKQQGDGELKKELLAGIRKTNKPTVAAIRESARSKLPKGGGLADLVARSSMGTRTRLSGESVGVQIRGTGRSVRGLVGLNEGHLRHPVFGTKAWVDQSVPTGFFDEPIEKDLPRIRAGIQAVMGEVARKVEKGH